MAKHINRRPFQQAVKLLIGAIFSICVLTASAEPQMQVIESALEGTSVLSMNIRRNGTGKIVLRCHNCEDRRITLKVKKFSTVIVNDVIQDFREFSPGRRDFTTGFYLAKKGELSRLVVKR